MKISKTRTFALPQRDGDTEFDFFENFHNLDSTYVDYV